MNFTANMFDLSNTSDLPADLSASLNKPAKARAATGPSAEQVLVKAVLENVPGKIAMSPKQITAVIYRVRIASGASVENVKESTVRGWCSKAYAKGLIAKATGTKGYCALDSKDVQTADEAAARKAAAAKLSAAKAAKRTSTAEAPATPAMDALVAGEPSAEVPTEKNVSAGTGLDGQPLLPVADDDPLAGLLD